MMASVENAPAFAQHWARQLGAGIKTLERLHGGINNRVFGCRSGDQRWVIKGYSPAQPGQRDRMQAEVEFLKYAAQVAPGVTPALLHTDPDRRCVVLEHLEGHPFPEGDPPPRGAVVAAVHFIHLLNRDPCLARESIRLEAAEGFLSLRMHLTNVQERIQAMSCEHLDFHTRPKAQALLQRVGTELAEVGARTNNLIEKGILEDAIRPDQRCVSPSDFGFHNAISTATGVRFIDFEFAGLDDPAKATLDFILQPRMPVKCYGSPLLNAWPPEHQHDIEIRCQHMAPILRLKWLCILLAVLNPGRMEQIMSTMPWEGKTTLINKRIKSARIYLDATKEVVHKS